jgi:translation initiation factor IF-2
VLFRSVVTFLGHVDHGKTSLLDAIIGTDVVSGEAGGITQHIRAYQIKNGDKRISFVDTPGHEAFTEMRARGANVTDIAVLVVAADDGIMPQTEEAISHAKAAGVPIIVAMNKIDLPGANPEKIYQELAARDLLPSEWGGQVEVVKTSATKKTGIDDLLDTILLTAEMNNYRADPMRTAFGTCLEAEQQPGRGVVVKMIIQGGTLNLGDIIVCGAAHGRVKAMYDTLHPNRKIEHAPPSMPVNLTGLDIAPNAGDKFHVLDDITQARELATGRENRSRQQSLGGITTRVSLEDFQKRLESGTLGKTEDIVTLNLIIRADVRGSIEAIQKELTKVEHPEVRLNILQALVGGVTIADVRLAQASQAVIIGFNVVPDEASRSLADELQVEIRRYDIIYKVTDDIRATLEGRLKPEKQIVEQGMAMVLQVFNISKVGAIAGCRVMRGSIQRDCRMRIIRDSRVIGEYAIDSLKREKDDAREVQRGMECGIKLVGFNDVKEADTLEAFKIEEVARTL